MWIWRFEWIASGYGYGYDRDMDVDMDMDMDIDVYHRPNLELACNVGCRLFSHLNSVRCVPSSHVCLKLIYSKIFSNRGHTNYNYIKRLVVHDLSSHVCLKLYTLVCGMWYVVCGMWYVVCGMWYVAYGMYTITHILHTTYHIPHTTYQGV